MVRPTVPLRFKVAGDHADVPPVGQKQNQSWKGRPLLEPWLCSVPVGRNSGNGAHFGRVAVLVATIAIIVALVESLTVPVARSNPRPVALASQIQSPSDLDSAAFSLSAGGAGWEASAEGTVTAVGGARTYGSLTFQPNMPIVGMAATPDRRGYWLVAADGGVFSFGTPSSTDRRVPSTSISRSSEWHRATTAGVLDGGGGWWRVLLRGRPVLRIDGQHPPQSAHRRHHSDAQWAGLLDGRIGRRHL